MRNRLVIWLLHFYVLSTLVSTAVMGAGFAALLLAFFLLPDLKARLRTVWESRRVRQYLGWSVALSAILVFSVVIAIYRKPPTYGHPLDIHFVQDCKKLMYLFGPVIFFATASSALKNGMSTLLRSHWIFMAVLVVVGCIQFFTGWPREQILGMGTRYSAAVLFMGLSLSVSSALTLAVFPVFSFWIDRVRNRGPIPAKLRLFSRVPAGFVAFGTFLVIFLTFSRMSWLTLPIGVALMIGLKVGWRKFALVLVVCGAMLCSLFFASSTVRDRASYSGGYRDRIELWKGHLEIFQDFPVLGFGFRQNAKVVETVVVEKYRSVGEPVPKEFFGAHAHNNWIEILAASGSAGFIVFLFWNIFVFLILKGGIPHQTFGWWFQGALVGFAVFHLNGLTQVNFWDSKVLHQLMLLVGVGLVLRDSDEPLIS